MFVAGLVSHRIKNPNKVANKKFQNYTDKENLP